MCCAAIFFNVVEIHSKIVLHNINRGKNGWKTLLYLMYVIYSGTLRVWCLDLANRKIRPQEVNMGQVKRVIRCIEVKQY